jgi:hypothetical protein
VTDEKRRIFANPIVSKVPAPITPIRAQRGGDRFSAPKQAGPADWTLWSQMPKAELWEAVALSLNFQPGHWDMTFPRGISLHYTDFVFSTDYSTRLKVAQAHMSAEGTLKPLNLYVGVLNDPRAEVSLPAFHSWANSMKWTLPAEFPSGAALADNRPVANKNGNTMADKPMPSVQETTFLTIIAALCKEAKMSYETPAKTAGNIRAAIQRLGADVGETTIEGYLKKIPAALEKRSK